MQLALIYGFLVLLFKPFSKFRWSKIAKPVTIIITLWLFSVLSGASPSVLRAAVMLTSIVVGESFSKRASIYNTLAASAFLLLCYNPYWLWDAGFQLSYIAVLSIVIFSKHIYHLIYIQNKILDFIWELISVTLAAQILTTPISIFLFHQFPRFFLLSNIIAVPLSTIILFAEIFLCGVAFIPFIAKFAGTILHALIWLMNTSIERIENMPFSNWGNLQINIPQVLFLYGIIIGIAVWMMQKNKTALRLALLSLLCFLILRDISFYESYSQRKFIVYNIAKLEAVDFIDGRNYMFKGDSILQEENAAQNFVLSPSRRQFRIMETDSLSSLQYGNSIFLFAGKRILIIDHPLTFIPSPIKIKVDVIILSKNPSVNISNLSSAFDCTNLVIDASNSNRKITKWKQECEQLHLSCHAIVDKGAFVMNAD